MTQPSTTEQLLNLADRAERHGLTPAEAARLRAGVAHHCARADEAEAEAREFKENYLRACSTVAAMHAAAVGRDDLGPVRGVVEDVADVRSAKLQAEAAIERVRNECDRIEAAVTDNLTSPDLAGGYLACLRHIRAALDEQQEQPTVVEREPVCNCTWGGLEIRRCPVHEPTA